MFCPNLVPFPTGRVRETQIVSGKKRLPEAKALFHQPTFPAGSKAQKMTAPAVGSLVRIDGAQETPGWAFSVHGCLEGSVIPVSAPELEWLRLGAV